MASSRRIHRFLVDVTPLRQSVEYRWLYGAQFASAMGRQILVVAVPFQVYQLSGSALLVGSLGIVQFVPLFVMGLVGGSIADSMDRRRLLLLAQLGQGASALGLVWNATTDQPAFWPLYLMSAINAGISAIDGPTRKAIIPRVVGRGMLPSAFALEQTLGQVAHAVGPALGGVLVATAGMSVTYVVDAALFAVSALVVTPIGASPPEDGGRRAGLESIKEGLRYLKGQRLLISIFAVDLNAMVFGMPRALFPAIGTEFFGGNAAIVGLLYAAPGIGAFLTAVTSGWIGPVRRRGLGVLIAVVVWGVAISLFGLTNWLLFAMALLAIAGGADVVSAVLRNTMLQLRVPDRLRGRMSSVSATVTAGGPRLGDLEAGIVAELVSVQASVVSGGIACVLGCLLVARAFPELVNYRGEPDEYVG